MWHVDEGRDEEEAVGEEAVPLLADEDDKDDNIEENEEFIAAIMMLNIWENDTVW